MAHRANGNRNDGPPSCPARGGWWGRAPPAYWLLQCVSKLMLRDKEMEKGRGNSDGKTIHRVTNGRNGKCVRQARFPMTTPLHPASWPFPSLPRPCTGDGSGARTHGGRGARLDPGGMRQGRGAGHWPCNGVCGITGSACNELARAGGGGAAPCAGQGVPRVWRARRARTPSGGPSPAPFPLCAHRGRAYIGMVGD